MRIASITITVVAVPDAPLQNVLGCHQPNALRNIIQVHTDDGIIWIPPRGQATMRNMM
jgi:glucarate dehydratase